MLNFKQIGFYSILFLLLMACDDNYNNTRGPYSPGGISPTGTIAGDLAGVAVLVSSVSSNVSQMTMQIYGTGGKSALDYNGAARFQGTLMFSSTYTNQNYQYPVTSTYPAPSYNPCQSGRSIPFSCQGRLLEDTFECQANLSGSNHRIKGMLGPQKVTTQNYEIMSVNVLGPCTVPTVPGRSW